MSNSSVGGLDSGTLSAGTGGTDGGGRLDDMRRLYRSSRAIGSLIGARSAGPGAGPAVGAAVDRDWTGLDLRLDQGWTENMLS